MVNSYENSELKTRKYRRVVAMYMRFFATEEQTVHGMQNG